MSYCFSQMQYPEASNVRDYQKIQNYYGDMYNRQAVPVMHDNWAGIQKIYVIL